MARLSELYRALRDDGHVFTLLGVGPMSRTVVDVALDCSLQRGAPLVFIASRNQIDSRQLGGGYVEGWQQRELQRYSMDRALRAGDGALCFVCRDHGGPWQKDEEFNARLDWEAALERALVSYRDDIEAGFDCLHVDTSKDPRHVGVVPPELAVERAVQIMTHTESLRSRAGRGPLDYEVSLDETVGAPCSVAEFESAVVDLVRRLDQAGLPRPFFIVCNTGALVRMDGNVGHVDFASVGRLRLIAERHGMVLKEHNADYLDNSDLVRHPAAGIAMANVAPELGQAESEALLELCRREDSLLGCEHPRRSGLREKLLSHVSGSNRWRKWVPDAATANALFAEPGTQERIIKIAGHYFLQQADVREARRRLYDNCEQAGDRAHALVEQRIATAVGRYLDAFRLAGLGSQHATSRPGGSG